MVCDVKVNLYSSLGPSGIFSLCKVHKATPNVAQMSEVVCPKDSQEVLTKHQNVKPGYPNRHLIKGT